MLELQCPMFQGVILVDRDGHVQNQDIQEGLNIKDYKREGATILKYENESMLRDQQFTIQLTHDLQNKNRVTIEMETYDQVNMAEEQEDELSFATNWKRAFMKIYVRIKWLNAYATINEIAVMKILKKFMKEHFDMPDNILDKNIQMILGDCEFTQRLNI